MARKKRIPEKKLEKARLGETLLEQHKGRRINNDGISKAGVGAYQCLLLTALIVAGFLIYSNTLRSPFVLDDTETIVKNRYVRATEFSGRSITDAAFGGHARNRPIPMVSFALNYYFGRYDVVGYHLINIMIHIINGILLFLFLKMTFQISKRQRPDTSALDRSTVASISFFAAFLWLVHPLQTQSVTYVVQRMNSMAAMFYLLSFLFYVKGRIRAKSIRERETQNLKLETRNSRSATRNPQRATRNQYLWFAASVFAWLLALGCKESAATLPLMIFLYEWFFFQDLNKNWLKKHLKYLVVIASLSSIVALMYLGVDPWEKLRSLRDFSHGQFTISERLLTQARVVIYYLSLIFYPHPSRLNLDYDFPLSHSLLEPATTLLCFFVIVGLVGLAIYLAQRDRLLSFCVLWFLGNLVIESSIIPLAIIFEHRTYLPSMLVCLMAVIVGFRYIRPKVFVVTGLCVMGVVYSFWTYERNEVWRDDVTLWRDCAEKSPQKARPHTNLGFALAEQGNSAEAISHYAEALRLRPDFAEAHNNLGLALEDQGSLTEAMRHYTEALRLQPGFAEAHNNLGNAFLSQGNLEEAEHHFSEALQIKPGFAEAHNNLGNVLLRQGNVEKAIHHYQEARRLNPHYAETHYNLGIVLLREENIGGAIGHFSEALKIKPDYAEAHSDLGIALSRQGRLKEGNYHLLEAVKIEPDNAVAHYNLAVAFVNQEELEEATRHFAEALRIKPDYAEAHYNLGNVLLSQGKLHKAMNAYEEALRHKPNFVEAHCNLGAIFLSQGNFPEAIMHYSAALKIKPGFAEAHYNLGSALLGRGRVKEAIHHYRETLRIEPNHQKARAKLDALLQVGGNRNESGGSIAAP